MSASGREPTCLRLLLVLLLMSAGTGRLAALDVVTEGKTEYVIVGDAANPAVKDLQLYIERMSGAKPPIRTAGGNPDEKAIVVGTLTQGLAPQEYELRVDGKRVLVSGGGPDGVSNGIYALLDDHWGCRFLTKDADFVPRSATLSLPDGLSERMGPSIRDRTPDYGLPVNSSMQSKDWLRRNRVSAEVRGCAGHNLYQWLPPSKYLAAHPDWYPQGKDGKRKPDCDWLCWTNEEMLKELTRLVMEKMARTGPGQRQSLGQGDGFSAPCQCPKCRALVERFGSEAAPIVWGLNRVIAETVKAYPKHEIAFFAYVGTLTPPVKGEERLVPHPNLSVTFVRMGDAMKTVDAGNNRKEIMERFLGWKSLTSNLQIWSWSCGFNNLLTPFPNYKVMAEDTKWFAPQVRGFMHQMAAVGEWGQLREWIFARVMWNAKLDVEETERDFLRSYYGEPAAGPLWTVLDAMQKSAAACLPPFNAVYDSSTKNVRARLFPPEQMAFCQKAFDEAIAAAEASGNVQHVARVKDTYASSFAMLLLAEGKPLKRVLAEGREWILPDGNAQLRDAISRVETITRKVPMSEWSCPEVSRRYFLNTVGGAVAPVVENDKVRLGFCLPLDGVLCSFVDKETNTELLRVAPPPRMFQTGIFHAAALTSSAADHVASVTTEDDVARVTVSGAAITNAWQVFQSFRHDRVYEFGKDRSGFTVKSYIYANPRIPDFHAFSVPAYAQPPFNLVLNRPQYESRVTMRFAVPSGPALNVTAVSPQGTAACPLDTTPKFQLSLPPQRPEEAVLQLRIAGVVTGKLLCVATFWADWDKIEIERDAAQQELVLRFEGPKKAIHSDRRTLATAFDVDLLRPEAAGRQPSGLRETIP